MKVWQWIVFCVLTYIFFLIAYFPAQYLAPYVNKNPDMSVENVSGTIWEGKAQRVTVRGIVIQRAEWSLSAIKMLLGKVSVAIDSGKLRDKEQVYIKGELTLSMFSQTYIELTDLDAYIPTHMVIAQLQLPLPVNASGRFKLAIEDFVYDNACSSLTGTGNWLNGTVSGTKGPIEFGNFDAELSCNNEDIQLNIQPNNLLMLSAKALIKPNGKFALVGKFKPDESLPEEVSQAASFFGQADASGFISIQL